MSVDLLVERTPPPVRRFVLLCNYVIIASFLLFLVGAGLWLSYVSRARTFQGIPEVSYSWVTMSLPVGACLLLVTTLLKLRHAVRDSAAARQPAA
jgi:TRAP-type C4-dicarboxylate transport system permease small subunit